MLEMLKNLNHLWPISLNDHPNRTRRPHSKYHFELTSSWIDLRVWKLSKWGMQNLKQNWEHLSANFDQAKDQ